jgi:hypothetical protein
MSVEFDGRRYLDADETFPVLTWGCTECGALVHDMSTHNRWHDRFGPVPAPPVVWTSQAPPETPDTPTNGGSTNE